MFRLLSKQPQVPELLDELPTHDSKLTAPDPHAFGIQVQRATVFLHQNRMLLAHKCNERETFLHRNSMLSAHKCNSAPEHEQHAFSTQVNEKQGWQPLLAELPQIYMVSGASSSTRPTTLPTACNAIKRLLKMQSNDCTNDSNESNDLQQTTSKLPRLPLHRRSPTWCHSPSSIRSEL